MHYACKAAFAIVAYLTLILELLAGLLVICFLHRGCLLFVASLLYGCAHGFPDVFDICSGLLGPD